MRKLFTFGVIFFALSLLPENATTAKPLPIKLPFLKKEDPKPVKEVPPPVLSAFNEILQEIADQQGFSLSEINNFIATWTKEKNEYQVFASFVVGVCNEGGVVYTVTARFEANGDIVMLIQGGVPKKYILTEALCIRIGF
jgi:hypothetical protein